MSYDVKIIIVTFAAEFHPVDGIDEVLPHHFAMTLLDFAMKGAIPKDGVNNLIHHMSQTGIAPAAGEAAR